LWMMRTIQKAFELFTQPKLYIRKALSMPSGRM
jgi:hypothetical protein